MDRTRFEQLVPDYIENSLSGGERGEFNAWLKTHPEAREEVRALRELILDVSDIEVPDPGSTFWTRFLPDVRTRMEIRAETVGMGERLRRVLLRPAIIGSFALATAILALLVLFSNMGPRGEQAMEARRLNHGLEAALRGTEESTLADLETFFDQRSRSFDSVTPLISTGLTLSAAESVNGSESWLDAWLAREAAPGTAAGDRETYRLMGELDTEESNRLQELLRAEITTG